MKFNPNALAECGDSGLDERPEVQEVDARMIFNYVLENGFLPDFSAKPFAEWLNENWYDFTEEEISNKGVVSEALASWRGCGCSGML